MEQTQKIGIHGNSCPKQNISIFHLETSSSLSELFLAAEMPLGCAPTGILVPPALEVLYHGP